MQPNRGVEKTEELKLLSKADNYLALNRQNIQIYSNSFQNGTIFSMKKSVAV